VATAKRINIKILETSCRHCRDGRINDDMTLRRQLILLLPFLKLILQYSLIGALETTSTCPTMSHEDLVKIVKQAFPHLISFESTTTISQANAEGQRLVLTLHEDDNPYDHAVFVKRVVVADYIHSKKDWPDLRRTLLYARTEIRFYQEILPKLQANFEHPIAPRIHLAHHSLDPFIPDSESGLAPAGTPPSVYESLEHHLRVQEQPSVLAGMSGEIIMECVSEEDYMQASPITIDQAKQCLTAVAQLHAAAWQNHELLQQCAERLSLASFHLEVRNPKELASMGASWEHFSTQFQAQLQEAGLRERTQGLGKRLQIAAKAISQQLSPHHNDAYATLVHGDYKAMNVFLPKDPSSHSNNKPLLVDFASTGIGFGMSDVAMHIHHAILPQDLSNGGEEALVDHYWQTIKKLLPSGMSYPRDIAQWHYKMAVVDYGRFVLGRFWKSATPEAFLKQKDSPNATLINRNVAAAMAFIDRMERYLTEFEQQQKQPVQTDVMMCETLE
jgi:thiamine kinase-like enzyme